MEMGRQRERQASMIVTWAELPRSPGHVETVENLDFLPPVMTRSLYPSFSSVWKDWKFTLSIGATRTAPSRHSLDHARILQVGSADLLGSIGDNLLGGQDAILDQLPDDVRVDAKRRCGFGHGQPLTVFLGRAVGVDVVDPPQRADALGRP